MKRLLAILVTALMITSFFALPSYANGEISIKEVYFFADGEEIMEVKAGDVSSKLLVSNSSGEKNINVIIALYDEEMRLEGVKRASGVLNAGADEQVVRVPAISVSDADNREVRVFLWDKENFGVPVDGKKVLKAENTDKLESITLYADGKTYKGTINPDTKEITFDFSAYVMGGNSSAMPDLADAYFEMRGTQLRTKDGEIDFSKPMTLISSGEGPTEKYTVNSNQYIVLKSDDAEGSRPGIASERVAINGYNNNSVTSVPRLKSGSNEEGTGNALKFPALPTSETIYVDRTTAKGLSGYPKVADEIIFSFDIRYDGFEYSKRTSPFGRGDIILGRGTRYNANGSTYAITFARSSEFLPDGLEFDSDTQYVIGALGGSSNAGRHKKLNSPALDMGKWYSVKQVMKVNHKTGEFSYDFYLDGAHIGTIANDATDTWAPDGVIIPDAVATDAYGTFNWYAQTNSGTGVDYYLDNIKVEYSYGKNDKNVFLVGDSLMSETIDTTSVKQGIGKYISQLINDAGLSIVNTAKAGHQAKFYLEGGANNDTTFAADWQGIKTQLGSEDAVIVSIGANDWAYRADKAELLADLKEIIGDAKNKGAKVLVSSQTPDFDFDGGKFKQRTEVNECLKDAADYFSVPYVDLGKGFEDALLAKTDSGDNNIWVVADQYFVGLDKDPADWTHLSEAGAELAAEILVGFINDKLDFDDEKANTDVLGASVTLGDLTFDGVVNPETKEITFYVDAGRYAGVEGENVKIATYIRNTFLANYDNYIKEAIVKIKTEATVDKAGIAQDFTNGPVTYKIGNENWAVSFVETNIQYLATMDEGTLTKEDRIDLPVIAEAAKDAGSTMRWYNGEKDDMLETEIVSEKGNNVFKVQKKNKASKSGFFALTNMDNITSNLVINSVDIRIDELSENEGFYYGFSSSRQISGGIATPVDDTSKGALVFTRSGKQVIDDKISLKYVNTYTDGELKTISGVPELDFNQWYNIKTVQKATKNGDSDYTVVTEVYIDNIYVGQYSSNYTEGIYRAVMTQLGSWNESDTTFSIKLDNLKTSYVTTQSDIK